MTELASASTMSSTHKHPIGSVYGLLAALLFGVSTPFAKMLLEHTGPVMLAGLLYFGSGLGLGVWRMLARTQERPASLMRLVAGRI